MNLVEDSFFYLPLSFDVLELPIFVLDLNRPDAPALLFLTQGIVKLPPEGSIFLSLDDGKDFVLGFLVLPVLGAFEASV